MMDDIDRNIVMDAFADYELVFHSVQEIAATNKCNLYKAFVTFKSKFNKLSKQVPLSYYITNKLGDYGTMEAIPPYCVTPEVIFTNSGELAGPPYYFFSYKDVQEALIEYDYFINTYGLPKWLTEK